MLRPLQPPFERWLLELPVAGPLLRDYRAGLGMPVPAKVAAVGAIAVAVTASVLALDLHAALLAGFVLVGAVGVLVVLVRVPTRR